MDDNQPASPEGNRAPDPIPPRRPMQPPPLLPQPVIVQARARAGSGWKVVAIVCLVLLLISLVFNPLHMLGDAMGDSASLQGRQSAGPRLHEATIEYNQSKHKVAVIPVQGVISGDPFGRSAYTMVDLIEDQFDRAAKDDDVKAVVLKVVSPGGEVLASDDIYQIIQKFQKKSGKPVVASMGSMAASGGYYVSAPCQWIVANELTITGSIGVIMHGYNWRGLMDKVGVRPEVFKSGKFKDMLSPDKRPEDITDEERELVQSMVNETFDKFKSVIREGRAFAVSKGKNSAEKPKPLNDNWEKLADGRILSGKEAMQYGFVDELGDFDAAVARAAKLANIPNANVIEYQQPFNVFDVFSILGESRSSTIKIDLGVESPRLKLGHLYFLSPTVLPR